MKKDNGWNKNTKTLLINWSKQISINEVQHRHRGTLYKRLNIGMKTFDIVAKLGILTTLISAIFNTYTGLDVLIFITVIETIILLFDGINTAFDMDIICERHFNAAKDYSALSKLIDEIVSLDPKSRGKATIILKSVRKQFNTVSQNSPDLPYNKVVHSLDMNIYDNPEDAIGNLIKEEKSSTVINEFTFNEKLQEIKNAENNEKSFTDYISYQWQRLANIEE